MTARVYRRVACAALTAAFLVATASAAPFRLASRSETFFMEDDLAYARFLWFEADGTYRQINRDRTSSTEVDRGTWEQPTESEIRLHPTNGMLSFRAVSSGPLLVMLDTQSRIDTAPALASRIAAFLRENQDLVFATTAVAEVNSSAAGDANTLTEGSARLSVSGSDRSFDRSNLSDILRQLNLWISDRSTDTFSFDLVPEAAGPALLIQRGAVFSKAALDETRKLYHVRPNVPPPFYFARIDRKTFLKRAGAWEPFENLGGTHASPPTSRRTP